MKVILTEKITKLGNIGDCVEVKTGYARNYLLPNGKAMRHTKENVALFEAKKAELVARHENAKKTAESKVDLVKNAKLHMIRQAGDTGQLYGSVSSRDIARELKEVAGVSVESAQVMLGSPIKSVGVFDTKIALHPDVIVDVKIYVAQSQDEIDALVAGKKLTFGTKKAEESVSAEQGRDESVEEKKEEKPAEEKKEEQAEPKAKKTAKTAKAEKAE